MSIGLPTILDQDIKDAIADATQRGLPAVAAPGRPQRECSHLIKYTNSYYGGSYPPAPRAGKNPSLFISPTPGFTWGPAVYMCPVAYPLSSAIYGRCGVVARISTKYQWRIFDACNPNVANLYVKWSREQPMSSMLALTTHSQLANQILRITFRTRFKIDIVVFPPDEMNRTYTNRTRDRWLAISEWSPSGRLRSSGSANIPRIPRLCVVVAEEFEKSESGIGRRPHIGPTQLLKLTMPAPDKIIEAYKLQNILVVSP